MLPGRGLSFFLTAATSVCFPLCRLIRKVSRAKGNPSIQILEYSTLRPKLKTQIWISNFVGAKLSHYHPGVNSFWDQLGYSLVLEIPGDSSRGFLFDFPCWGLLCFSFSGELHECSNGEMVKQIFLRWDFTILLISWGSTCDLWPRCTCLYHFQFLLEFLMTRIFDITWQPTSPRTLVNGFAYRLFHIHAFQYFMEEIFYMYDVWDEPVLEQNVSCSIQTW